jgi:hypothetical protein
MMGEATGTGRHRWAQTYASVWLCQIMPPSETQEFKVAARLGSRPTANCATPWLVA